MTNSEGTTARLYPRGRTLATVADRLFLQAPLLILVAKDYSRSHGPLSWTVHLTTLRTSHHDLGTLGIPRRTVVLSP